MNNRNKQRIYLDEAYQDLTESESSRRVVDWFKQPLEKVDSLYGVTFVTVKPFLDNAIDSY